MYGQAASARRRRRGRSPARRCRRRPRRRGSSRTAARASRCSARHRRVGEQRRAPLDGAFLEVRRSTRFGASVRARVDQERRPRRSRRTRAPSPSTRSRRRPSRSSSARNGFRFAGVSSSTALGDEPRPRRDSRPSATRNDDVDAATSQCRRSFSQMVERDDARRRQMHDGPSCDWFVVFGADRRAVTTPPVLIETRCRSSISTGKRSRPRGAGPPLLTDPVVLRAVARALEPLRRRGTTARGSRGARTAGTARRCPASMPTMIGWYDVDLLRVRQGVAGIRPRGTSARRARSTARGSRRSRRGCRRALPALILPPNPPEVVGHRKPRHRRAEAGGREADDGEHAAVEELTAGDAELFLVDRLPLDDARRSRAPPGRRPPVVRGCRRQRSRPVASSSVDVDDRTRSLDAAAATGRGAASRATACRCVARGAGSREQERP